jgi:hypothetical protein
MTIVYASPVGLARKQPGHVHRRNRSLSGYLYRGRPTALRNRHRPGVDVIVVTDAGSAGRQVGDCPWR